MGNFIIFRCENTLANSTGEVEALTQAGKKNYFTI
jgi:hypothetical protein